ncbi:MAG: hypothetical protein KVP17_000407 [Porospora cf. gigantea B]|uniref:uncharacterized protein n=1 Tax=Porospora cf. gigantea B TaxID=2853592 RepID=UPI003571CE13|nr:MAG: hypothetical protein KVP17_000407 [Porospora cf. gigantea B]
MAPRQSKKNNRPRSRNSDGDHVIFVDSRQLMKAVGAKGLREVLGDSPRKAPKKTVKRDAISKPNPKKGARKGGRGANKKKAPANPETLEKELAEYMGDDVQGQR